MATTRTVSYNPSRRRVLHIIKRMDVSGGAERMVAELVKNSPSHSVLFYGGEGSFYRLDNSKITFIRGFFRAAFFAVANRKKYDVFHLHLFPSIYMALILGKKSIIHEHNSYNARRNFFAFRIIEFFIYRRAQAIISISEAAKLALDAWIFSSRKTVVIPNFVPTLRVEPRQEFPGNQDGLTRIAMVASFTDQKKQHLLIDALQFLPDDFEVLFAGEGPNLPRCRERAERLGLTKRIRFLGAVKDISEIYSSVDLCVLVSNWEGFGLVVLEAAQFGIPTVVSDVPGLKDISPDPRFVLKKDEPEDLAKLILVSLKRSRNPEVRNNLIEAARKHGIDPYFAKIEKIYKGS